MAPATAKLSKAKAKTGPKTGKTRKIKRRKRQGRDLRHLRELGGLALAAAAVFLAIVLYLGWSGGFVGGGAVAGLRYLVGVMVYLAPVTLVAAGLLLIFPEAPRGPRAAHFGLAFLLAGLFLLFGANTASLLGEQPHPAFFSGDYMSLRGGIVGESFYWATSFLVGDLGSTVAVVFLLLASGFLLTGASVRTVLLVSGRQAHRAALNARRTTLQLSKSLADKKAAAAGPGTVKAPFGAEAGSARPVVDDPLLPGQHVDGEPLDGASTYPDIYEAEAGPARLVPTAMAEPSLPQAAVATVAETDAVAAESAAATPQQAELFPRSELEAETGYIVPNPDLLKKSSGGREQPSGASDKISKVLVDTLASFGIEARVVGAVSGPRVTRYELQLAPGIKVAKVSNLKNDIAYALATTDIRILAPIPGKSAVGVEVPNHSPNLVTLGDIFRDFPAGSGPLMAWLGKDISGKPVFADLAMMPHLLVAGTTGSGKSGCINCLLSSILLHSSPDDVGMILIDPKRVELNYFEGIPHLLTPVVTVMKEAANVLANLVAEMESRYSQMQLVKARHLDEMNKIRRSRGQKPLPYILLVVDELADLMMVSPAEVEDAIIRLAQKSRAVGIHLVLATQRPSVDVITGMIKANVPSRIAFAVSSQIDSRVILDTTGAESLLGQGDMLFRPLGSSRLQRIQGAYISEEEVAQLTERCKTQKEPDFQFELLEGKSGDDEERLPADEDDLLREAAGLVVATGTASVSFLQRRLRVGYTRAGRLIDMLEKRGVISGYEGSKPRRVLMSEGDLERVFSAAPAEPGTEQLVDELPAGEEL